jgi:hypothetical protein
MNYKFFISVFAINAVQYKTALSSEEVIKRIEEKSEPENYLNPFRGLTSSKQYGGGVSGNKFELTPRKFMIPSLTPSISGSLKMDGVNTVIEVELICRTGAFSGFILIIFGIVAFKMFWDSLSDKFDPFYLIGPCMFAILALLINGIYLWYVKECKRDLAKIFEAEPTDIK